MASSNDMIPPPWLERQINFDYGANGCALVLHPYLLVSPLRSILIVIWMLWACRLAMWHKSLGKWMMNGNLTRRWWSGPSLFCMWCACGGSSWMLLVKRLVQMFSLLGFLGVGCSTAMDLRRRWWFVQVPVWIQVMSCPLVPLVLPSGATSWILKRLSWNRWCAWCSAYGSPPFSWLCAIFGWMVHLVKGAPFKVVFLLVAASDLVCGRSLSQWEQDSPVINSGIFASTFASKFSHGY